jgi:hypothetical protein
MENAGLDGLKPYMRYTLAGGYNYEAENASGLPYKVDSMLLSRRDPRDMLVESMSGLMDSPGHRRNILNKWHKKVNLGIAYDRATATVVQQFEGDYIEFTSLPSIENGLLSLAGKTLDGFAVEGMGIYYDPIPTPLTRGQLGQTYCYSLGLPIVFFRPPPGPGKYYVESTAEATSSGCVDPYLLDSDIPPPEPLRIREGFRVTLVPPPQSLRTVPQITFTVPLLDAARWDVSSAQFSIQADISKIISEYGDGVYTVVVWGEKAGEEILISEYSIFTSDQR